MSMLQVVSILCLAIYGSLISLLVGLKHEIAGRLKLDDSKAGALFSVFMFFGAVSVIILSSSIDYLGHKTVACFGLAFTSLSLVFMAFCRKYAFFTVSYLLMSIGAMCIVSVGNTLLPLALFGGDNPSAATNLGNGFYGVGAFFVSFFLTDLLKRFGYRITVLFFALLLAVASFLAFLAEYPEIHSNFSCSDLPAVLTNTAFLLALATNFFGAGAENGVSSWANTYMSRLGADDRTANRVLSMFFIAVMVSRLVTALFVTPGNTPVVLVVFALVAISALAVMTFSEDKVVAACCIVVLGFALGSACPSIFGYMFSKTDIAYHGTAFGIIFSTGLLGGSFMPYMIGAVSERFNLRKGYLVNLVSSVMLGVCALLLMIVK